MSISGKMVFFFFCWFIRVCRFFSGLLCCFFVFEMCLSKVVYLLFIRRCKIVFFLLLIVINGLFVFCCGMVYMYLIILNLCVRRSFLIRVWMVWVFFVVVFNKLFVFWKMEVLDFFCFLNYFCVNIKEIDDCDDGCWCCKRYEMVWLSLVFSVWWIVRLNCSGGVIEFMFLLVCVERLSFEVISMFKILFNLVLDLWCGGSLWFFFLKLV